MFAQLNIQHFQFYLGTQLLPEGRTYDFPSRESAICSPLAMKIFEIDGVKSAFISSTFLAINKVGKKFRYPRIFIKLAGK